MKSINKLAVLFVLFSYAFNAKSQTTGKTLTLNTITSSGIYSARDWIELQVGFSFSDFTARSGSTKIVNLTWNYSGVNEGWRPQITLNSQTTIGTVSMPISGYSFYNFIDVITSFNAQLSNAFGSAEGWTFTMTYNGNDQTASIRIEKNADFALGSNYNYNNSTLVQNYSVATDGTFTAKIDEGLVFDAEYLSNLPDPERDLNKTLLVGSIPGNLDVSPTGAATYTIPIEVPPGTSGMQPTVSLIYNSQSGNGIAGYGWNISGSSAIIRCGKTKYYDNSVGGVNLDNNDRYALDGNRLVELSGTYGANNIEYRTINESFSVIKSFDSNADNQPEYFKVWTKDGKVIEYGNSSDSKILSNNKALFWCINKITDVNGKYIEYKYDNIDNELVLSEINYTGTSSTTPYNKIAFSYSDRTIDSSSHKLAGFTLNNKLLLRKISVTSEEEPVADYMLNYLGEHNFSQLAQIDLFKENQKLNPTILHYGDPQAFMTNTATQLYIPEGSTNISKKYWSSGDMNNDGLDDLICVYKDDNGNCYPYVYYSSPTTTGIPSFDLDGPGFCSFLSGYEFDKDFKSYNTGIRPVDVNGNGMKELMVPSFDRTELWSRALFRVLKPGGNWINIDESLQLSTNKMPAYAIKDLNNDGTDDIVYVENTKSGSKYYGRCIYTYPAFTQNDPEAFSFDTTCFNICVDGTPRYIYINDYDADGLQDVMVVTSADRYYLFKNENGVVSTTSVNNNYLGPLNMMKEGDFNGDGLMDFIMNWKNSTTWYLLTNNGNNSFTTTYIPIIDAIDNEDKDDTQDDVIVEDFNNDGKSDIIVRDAKYNSSGFIIGIVNWYVSTGDNFVNVSYASSTNKEYFYGKYYVAGDFNGDGRTEMMNYGYDCYGGGGSGIWVAYHTFNYGFEAYLLNKVTDGLNRKYNIQYRSLVYSNVDNDNFYTKGTTGVYPVSDIQPPLYCVKATDLYDGTYHYGNTYAYAKATVHKQGLGFLGFSEATQTNTTLGIKTTSTFGKEKTVNGTTYYTGGLLSQKIQTVTGSDISETQNTYEITEIDALKKRIMPWLKEVTTTDHLHGEIKSYTKNTINTDGNPVSVEVQNLEGTTLVAKTITSYSNYTDGITANSDANTYPNVPGTVVVNKTHKDDAGVTYSRTVNYTYNNKGLILTMVSDPGTSNALTTTNEYYTSGDILGQLKKTTLSASGLSSRYKEYIYDIRGRFITKETNTLGYYTTAEYDNQSGNLLWKNDILGNHTSFYYDAWDRPSETLLPTGSRTTNSINWYSGIVLPKAIYYTTQSQEETGSVVTYYDRMDRQIRVVVKNSDGQNIFTDYEYNAKGQLSRVSMPYFEGTASSAIKWTVKSYDNFNRLDLEVFDGFKTTDYQYNGATTKIVNTTASPNRWSQKTIDATGNVKTASDAGGTISYYYQANGQVKQIQAPGSTINIEFDNFGRQHTLNDPDAGIMAYNYNAFGELISQTDAESHNTVMTYDQLGRVLTKTESEGTTTYEYSGTGNGKGQIYKVTGPTGIYNSYEYDAFGRNTGITEYIDASHIYTTYNTFDNLGRITGVKYPTGFSITNTYDAYGYLKTVKRVDAGTTIWQCNSTDQFGNITSASLGNGLAITRGFDQYGLPNTIKTGNLQNMEYSYNIASGDINWRKDNLTGRGFTDSFKYDQLDRLTNTGGNSYTYYDNGNIHTKPGAGTYAYGGPHPHAVTTLTDSPIVAPNDQSITYNSFRKPLTISEGTNLLTLTYDVDDERVKTVSTNGTTSRTRYFAGDYEEEWITGTTPSNKKIHYIYGGDGLAAMYIIDQNNTGRMYYVSKDPQGSIVLLTNQDGSFAEEYSYDAWGRRRSPTNWTNYNVSTPTISFRGYTGHEHLDEFSLINMNGRIYDPVLGVFLSPDNYVQVPDFTQNFNRYGYCLNNPLKYTDPSGEYIPFFAFPTIGWSKDGGLSLGLTVGIGVPGIASVQLSGNYAFKSNDFSASLGGTLYYNTITASYSGSSGWSMGYSAGLSSGNSPISTNFLSVGASYNFNSMTMSSNISAWSYNSYGGWSFNPSFSVNPVYYSSEGGFSYLGQGFVERVKAQRDLYLLASYYASSGGVEITADMINQVIAGLPADGTAAQYMGKALELMMQYPNAYVKGSTVLGIMKNPNQTTLNILNKITQISKTGNNVNIGLTGAIKEPIEGVPILGSINLKISTSNSTTITSATANLISLQMKGFSAGILPISGANITPHAINVKIGPVWYPMVEY